MRVVLTVLLTASFFLSESFNLDALAQQEQLIIKDPTAKQSRNAQPEIPKIESGPSCNPSDRLPSSLLNEPVPRGQLSIADSSKIASVNGRIITQGELDEFVRPQMQAIEERIYQLRNSALQVLIGEILISQAASRRGISVNDLTSEIVAGVRVDESEVGAAYDKSKTRLRGIAEFEAKEQIRETLKKRRRSEAYEKAIEQLRKESQVQVYLSPSTMMTVPTDPMTDSVIGAAKPEVTIFEFSDFECPYSKQAQEALRRLLHDYRDKVQLVFKHFPLSIHKTSSAAARAALCAQEQSRFWEYHDQLFSAGPPFSQETLKTLAGTVGLDQGRFAKCLDSEKHDLTINEHLRAGQAATVRGTPTFIVNGRVFRGALSYEQWKLILDQLLRQISTSVEPTGSKPNE